VLSHPLIPSHANFITINLDYRGRGNYFADLFPPDFIRGYYHGTLSGCNILKIANIYIQGTPAELK
jgi:hypothetical protein